MDRRRIRTGWAAGMAMALAGCAGTASPSEPAASHSSATPTPTSASSPKLPSATPSTTKITGPPFAGTLVFDRNVDDGNLQGDYRLFTMAASGGAEMQLLDHEGEQARWSRDGTRLSVVGPTPEGLIFVGFVDRDGTNLVWLDSPDATLNLGCGASSMDETTFACEGWDEQNSSRDGLYFVGADGTGLRRITTPPPGRHDAPCDFSPDGKRIAFLRINLADEDVNELMMVNADGSGEHRLIDETVRLGCRWSPDGSTILAVAEAGILAIMLPDSQTAATLLPLDLPAGATLSHPAWSVDGAHVVLSVRIGRQPLDIWIANRDGSGATQVTNTPRIDEEVESWGP
jgi:hypothetical protein